MTHNLANRFSTIPLREAHAHLPFLARSLTTPTLASCPDHDTLFHQLLPIAQRLDQDDPSRGRWLTAEGARVNAWAEGRWPDLARFDALTGSRPAFLLSFDFHSLLANSAAMAAAGIHPATPNPPGGLIDRDPSGQPTGLLLESAALLVRHAEPPPSPSQRERTLGHALAHLASLGFTEVHDLLAPPWLGPALCALHTRDQLPLRVGLYFPLHELNAALASRSTWERPRHVELLGGKVFADGTLNSRTAWMLHPFADPIPDHPRGTPLMSVSQLREAVATTRDARTGLAVHAIGDGAVRAALDAAQAEGGGRDGAVRIEHAEIIDQADVPRFARLEVRCSVQPCHLLADVEALHRHLPHRLGRVLPLRELADSGCRPGELMWFGSDVPIVRADPADSILAATSRRRAGMHEHNAISLHQALTQVESWQAFRTFR